MRNVAFSERYQSTAKLFADGQESLYEGFDTEAGKRVTLALLDGDPTPMQRLAFEREASLREELDHPLFLSMLAARTNESRPFLVLEALHAEPFERWVAGREPKVSQALRLLRRLAEGLDALHGRGYVHGRLAASRLWIAGSGHRAIPLLPTFGATLPIGSKASIPGAPPLPADPYLPPELYDATATVDACADLYSAGALVYRYLTGKAPVDLSDAGVDEAVERIRNVPIDLGVLPRPMRPVLGRLLTKHPRERFRSVEELVQALGRAAESEPGGGLSPGDRVDAYVVQSILGEGGFGTTVLARDETLQRDVALKFLHRGDADDLLQEARAMARVTHRNVATVYGYGMHQGSAYLVMEYLPGESLARVLEAATEPLPTADLVTILDETALGVEAVHSAGLVHGDLKPGNIVVGPAFRIGVTDFGLVQAVDEISGRPNRIEGTPAYLAPERIRGRVNTEIAHRIDVYALGILAYELITGEPPFKDNDRSIVMQRHLHAPVTAPSAIAGRLEALDPVVLRALHKDPKRRTPDVATFRQELRQAIEEQQEESAEGLRILLVDPERDERAAVAALVEKIFPAAHVAQAAIGSAALRRASKKPPDLLLLELEMPDMNGVELLAQLRTSLDDPPHAVIVTRAGAATDWPLLKNLGARAFMPKPLDEEIFGLVLERLVNGE